MFQTAYDHFCLAHILVFLIGDFIIFIFYKSAVFSLSCHDLNSQILLNGLAGVCLAFLESCDLSISEPVG